MGKYRVYAESVERYYVDIEAEDEDDAIMYAERLDGGDFYPVCSCPGDWEILSYAEELDEDDDVDYSIIDDEEEMT